MDSYRLHYFPESGNTYKLALMLTLCGQTFEPVWTDFGGGVTRTDAWRRTVNPMGEIPVLEENGVKLTQTGYLATYRFRRTFTADPDPAVLAFLRNRIDDFLGILDQRVKDRPFV